MKIEHLNFIYSFLNAFIPSLTLQDIKKIIKSIKKNKLYLWQIPIDKGANYIKGADATLAFDFIDKHDAFEFFYDDCFSDKEPKPLDNNHCSALLIREEGLFEFYVFASNFDWCFVVTHEGDNCGPFFFTKKQNK